MGRDCVSSYCLNSTLSLSVQSEGVYIRVMGSMKSFGNKKYINATHLRRIQDPTEVQFHFLEAMTVTLIFQKGPVKMGCYILVVMLMYIPASPPG